MAHRRKMAAFTVPGMLVPALGAFFYFWMIPGTRIAALVYAATKLFTLIWPLAALVLLEPGAVPWRLPQRPGRAVLEGLLSGSVMAAALLVLYLGTPLGQVALDSAPAIRHKVAQLGVLEVFVPFSVFLAVAHSLLEEVYWRWFIFGQLGRLVGARPAHLLAAASFALHHYVVLLAYFPVWLALAAGTAVGAGGFFWCVLYGRHGSVLGAWISHLLVDAAILWAGYQILFVAGRAG
ncbi:MAG: CPBP family intramembrane glutamic endopeptidase [Acidobacteriota bacterium]